MLSFDVSETAFLQHSWQLEKCQHFRPQLCFQEKRQQNNRAKPTRKPRSSLQVLCSLAEPGEKGSNAAAAKNINRTKPFARFAQNNAEY